MSHMALEKSCGRSILGLQSWKQPWPSSREWLGFLNHSRFMQLKPKLGLQLIEPESAELWVGVGRLGGYSRHS